MIYCPKCKQYKNESEFYNSQIRKNGKTCYCKECINTNNNGVLKKAHLERQQQVTTKKCQDCNEELSVNNFSKDCGKSDGYRNECKQCRSIKRKNSGEHQRAGMRMVERYHTETEFRLKAILRARLSQVIKSKNATKSCHTLELLGCTVQQLKEWIEFQFYDSMTWDNYGTYWHLDHCRPCCSFDLIDPDQQSECFHWSNLTPLRADKNISKGNKRNYFAECLQELKATVFIYNASLLYQEN
jgi:hypothetical protein